jgi:hypothetical protein
MPSAVTHPPSIVLSDSEYREIEARLAGDPRSREYLRQRDRRSRSRAIDKVRRLTGTLRLRLAGDDDSGNDGPAGDDGVAIRMLRRHLREMGDSIRQTRREMAVLGAPEGARPRITRATGELDAIVAATECATASILGSAERIGALVDELPTAAAAIGAGILAHTTEILTACAFHDITGQRLGKVVATLRYLEIRVDAMLAIWGDAGADPPPADAQDGITQAEIDRLFA